MEKARNIVVAVCTLAIAAFLWMQAGPQFMKMQAGAVTLQPGEELGQAQGQYVVYDAAYPVASCPEEYYTGDQSRVRTNGYVVYDAERKVFLYIVETDQSDGRYANLMYYLNLTADLRAEKDMSPAQVRGTLEPMDRAAIDRAVRTLEDSDVLDTYVESSSIMWPIKTRRRTTKYISATATDRSWLTCARRFPGESARRNGTVSIPA